MAVFLLSGLWHGANWTFVVWGALHGLALLAERAAGDLRRRLPAFLQVGLTFAFVSFAWIFFRAPTLTDATTLVMHLVQGWGPLPWPAEPGDAMLAALGAAAVCGGEARRARPLVWPRWVVVVALQAVAFAVVFLGVFQQQAFIYFQF
jgi:hypothetical protein